MSSVTSIIPQSINVFYCSVMFCCGDTIWDINNGIIVVQRRATLMIGGKTQLFESTEIKAPVRNVRNVADLAPPCGPVVLNVFGS